ncbi:DUF3237 domain-containing protein [Aspergillus brunneoviolaceus CBS 621.78]|uniref:Uncharacterized protein n=1 Tax=Aspergillus brunneoviolaceus CBS 621.78 TaxID=1450534 RepID=A0ACD1FVW4_9EURO|nr:hypothetical protein BO95DRAFT_468147 [Aspergillus brunneoviolaceus CBS 621.78]RAH41071.1 hypothetical protein BO95DRAFT_468147 [Aspergillus brunneoviolaceus CBS 621.78]
MSQSAGFPTLRPAYILKFEVGQGQPVGPTSSGSTFIHYVSHLYVSQHAHFKLLINSTVMQSSPGGTITTVEGFSPRINAQVVVAGDWLYFDPDQQHTRMNVHGIARTTEDEGIRFKYSGVSTVSEDLAAIFQGQPKTVAFGQSTMNMTFEVGSPRIKALENSNWVGNGRFKLEGDKLWVEVRIAQVVASQDMD